MRRDRGAAHIDRVALADVEEYGVARLPDELAAEPATPRPGSGERRPLSIPSVRDRIVQAAVKLVLEPIFEADTLDCSFGFRPGRVMLVPSSNGYSPAESAGVLA